ncbi:MAG: LysM peptidoglycan-binding domain-containing protein [Bacilli bacterium]|nr:LysM peptidoglycan-binding domain-containing protein [Bacilli bacterium]
MKQIVPFTKNIDFDTNVDEIISISLDKKVSEIKDGHIVGTLDLYLEYKENDISVNVQKYNESIPFDIVIDDRYALNDITVDIDDFYYEINDREVILHIDILVDNLTYDDKEIENIIERHSKKVIDSEDTDLFLEKDEEIKSVEVPIYKTFDSNNETYVTYNVHIVRDDDNIDSICQKYGVDKEELSYYNDISSIKLGDKLIVPTYKK